MPSSAFVLRSGYQYIKCTHNRNNIGVYSDASLFTYTAVQHLITAAVARSARDRLVMVALWNRADHYIFILWFLLFFFFFLFFFPRIISAVADWMSAILPYIVWP